MVFGGIFLFGFGLEFFYTYSLSWMRAFSFYNYLYQHINLRIRSFGNFLYEVVTMFIITVGSLDVGYLEAEAVKPGGYGRRALIQLNLRSNPVWKHEGLDHHTYQNKCYQN
ncbi:hypothetical protein FPQ18DRAFT_316764 [Pyronema domesticum]|nr:hypothetical protein FPQ18DRAFT_316764 [Pyronema domesticum]